MEYFFDIRSRFPIFKYHYYFPEILDRILFFTYFAATELSADDPCDEVLDCAKSASDPCGEGEDCANDLFDEDVPEHMLYYEEYHQHQNMNSLEDGSNVALNGNFGGVTSFENVARGRTNIAVHTAPNHTRGKRFSVRQ